MRIATVIMTLAAPLALAACGSGEETTATAEAPVAQRTPMAGAAPMAPAGEAGQSASGEGTVTAIDAKAGTITIDHGAIEAVKWPAMTMSFAADEAKRQQVAVGDKVAFEFRTTPSGGELTSISKM